MTLFVTFVVGALVGGVSITSFAGNVTDVHPDNDHPFALSVDRCVSEISARYPFDAPSKYEIGLSSRTFV